MGGQLIFRQSAATHPSEKEPIVGRIVSIVLSLVTISIIAVCFSRRVSAIHNWSKLPATLWLLVIIYVDSFIFVFVAAIIKDLGVNTSTTICEGAILLCLACYLTTKILIYSFLVERAHIVRASTRSRLKDKVYLFNTIGLITPYIAISIMNFVFRIAYINEDGRCIIGMEKIALIPLIAFDVFINIYLTILFLIPFRRLYSYRTKSVPMLHTITVRTFVGTCCTLASSVVNLTILTVLDGEPGWICLLACNADVLFSVLVLHWVTVTDKGDLDTGAQSSLPPARKPDNFADVANVENTNRASICTKIAAIPASKKNHTKEEDPLPQDSVRVRTDYQQTVEMDQMSQESTSWAERAGRKDELRASSIDSIV